MTDAVCSIATITPQQGGYRVNTTHHNRRITHYKAERERSFSRGFFIGFVSCAILVAAFMYGQREAYANERPAPRAAHTLNTKGWPPHWRTWLRIGMCEQPKRGISWHDVDTDAERFRSIAWRQEYNWSFAGGLGLTRLNWETFRPPSAKRIRLMSRASVAQQLWAAERLWRWAERTYPGNGHTAWECSYVIGWTTSDPQDALR